MKKMVITFIATLFFGFLFFYGLFSTVLTFSPLLTLPFSSNHHVASSITPVSSQTPTPTPEPTVEPIVHPYPAYPPNPPYNPADAGKNFIRIPSLGINIPLVESASLNDADVINALKSGVALYPNGVEPGALGNVFIAGHSTGNPWQGAFRFAFIHINELQPGNMILIDWHGARYGYRIYKSETIVPTAGYTVPSDRPYPTMSLMACWPLWSTSHRILVHADLVSITQLTTPVAQ